MLRSNAKTGFCIRVTLHTSEASVICTHNSEKNNHPLKLKGGCWVFVSRFFVRRRVQDDIWQCRGQFLCRNPFRILRSLFCCHHSVLNATTGSFFAARLAGIKPEIKVKPMLIAIMMSAVVGVRIAIENPIIFPTTKFKIPDSA